MTVPDGSFRLEGLAPGSITVIAHHDERGNASVVLQGRAGETVRWDAQLSRGIVLEGRVLDEADKPVEHVMVEATGPAKDGKLWPWSRTAGTDARGKFSVLDCPQGEVRPGPSRKS